LGNPSPSFKKIILLSERERLDVQYSPMADVARYPQAFKYSFNYRAFLKGRWIPLVRWDNSHQGCHIDLHGMRRKLPDEKRTGLQSFERVSDSIVDDLQHIRNAARSALDDEDLERLGTLLKSLMKTKLE